MKKVLSAILLFVAGFGAFASPAPDEGMWLPMFVERLNYVDMQKMGLNLSADEIYSINHSSLKDAIVNFGNFCTAEVVSPEGLLLTNHHCGYSAIQTHSSVEHDYLTDGFWAYNKKEELPNEGLTASFLVRMEDVTAQVLEQVNNQTSEADRSAAIKAVVATLKKENSEEGRYDVSVKGFFNGNEYYMFIYETFKDVRLVGAPPSSIGKFGGDTDNWMWPRHTGDFSMFRVYSAPDGTPATYAEENIPMKSKYSLPLSIAGVDKGDYTMIWGYPGGTDRYRTSYGIDQTLNHINPAINKVGGKVLELMKEDMDADDAVRIAYAAKYAQIANMWKNKIGESRGLKRLKVFDKKKQLEDQFQAWANADAKRKAHYGEVMSDFASAYGSIKESQFDQALWYFQLCFFGSQTFTTTFQGMGMKGTLSGDGTKDEIKAAMEAFKPAAEESFKDYNVATEKKIYAALLEMIRQDLPAAYQPDIFKTIDKKFKGDVQRFADEVFESSIFATKENFLAFLEKPSLKKLEKDLAFQATQSIYGLFISSNAAQKDVNTQLKKAKRLFVAGLREMNPNKHYYPDANFTMRVTYGQVLDYIAADAVHYDYITHLSGVMEKEDPQNDEFVVPAKLKSLFEAKDFGRYGKDGDLVVCFLSNNDITGGNSGSPIMNGNGELIGLAFDGNWEAMSGDIAFEPELQRTINVDIRYVLFVIDKYAGAQNLIDEMNIVDRKPMPAVKEAAVEAVPAAEAAEMK